ncbi:MAG: PAS domain-containing protein [Candidatus Micrarchaeota archaeon]
MGNLSIDLDFLAGTEELIKEGRFAKSLIESIAPEGLIVINKAGEIILCNPSTNMLTGHSNKELIKKKMASLFKEKNRFQEFRKEAEANLTESKYHTSIEKLSTKKGEEKIVSVSLSQIANSDDLVIILRDMTERIQTREIMDELLANYAIILENCSEGIVVIQDKKIMYVNSAMLEYIGYSADEVLGKEFPFALAPDERDKVVKNHIRRLSGEKFEKKYNSKILTKGGKEVEIELDSNFIKYNGKPAVIALIRPLSIFCQCKI